jgi:hypothetical protein
MLDNVAFFGLLPGDGLIVLQQKHGSAINFKFEYLTKSLLFLI